MIFGESSLQNYIVPALAESGALSPYELHDTVVEQAGPCTLQAIYKALSRLQDNGVIVKGSDGYSLHLNWCLEMVALTDSLLNVALSDRFLESALPVGKRVRKWSFNSLYRLNHFWCHLIMCAVKTTQVQEFYSWNPHAWFYLLGNMQEKYCLKTLEEQSVVMNKVLGNATYLDKWATRYWERDNVKYATCANYFSENKSEWLNVIGNYVVSVKFDPVTWDEMEKIYSSVRSESEVHSEQVKNFVERPVEAKMTVVCNKEKAEALVKKFMLSLS